MNLNKLQQKADLWLKLHGVLTFEDAPLMNCEDVCPYFHQCRPIKLKNSKEIIVYKDGCIKWLDDEGFDNGKASDESK
jgi:hypothetical protein